MKNVEATPTRSTSGDDYEKKIRSIHDHLYANSAVKTPGRIMDELSKVFKTLIALEKSGRLAPHITITDADAAAIRNFKHPTAKRWGAEVKLAYSKLTKGKAADSITLSDSDVSYVIGLLQGIPLAEKEKDYVGDALESIRTDWVKRHGGQFFTDQKVTDLALHLLDFSPGDGELFADICCGTGGFLISALKHARKKLEKKKISQLQLPSFLDESLLGHEVDAEVAAIANSTLGGLSSGLLNQVVRGGDSLNREALSKNGLAFNSVDCLASNPPFGIKITVKDPEILKKFELAKSGYKLVPRAPDLLLLEQNVNLLKPETGRLAIVLPYQILSGPQAFFVREWLLKTCRIEAIVDLPKETFQPHTGTRTSLVLLRKRKKALPQVDLKKDPPIFMSTPQFIGHDRRGNPVYRKSASGSFSTEILSDIQQVADDFKSFKLKTFKASEISFICEPAKIASDSQLRVNAEFFAPRNAVGFSAKDSEHYSFRALSELVKEISYPGRFKRDYVASSAESVPFLGGSNITELMINTSKYLAKTDPKYESLRVTAGTILITRSGTTGIVSTVPKSWEGYAISEHVIRIVPDAEKIPIGYLIAFFRSDYAQTQIKKGIFGSVIDEITPEHLGEIIVPIPKNKRLTRRISGAVLEAEAHRDAAISLQNKVALELNEIFTAL